MRARAWSVGLLVFFAGIAAGLALPGRVVPSPEPATASPIAVSAPATTPAAVAAAVESAMPADLTEDERRNIRIFREASRSTVHITSVGYRRDWFSFDVYQIPRGTGTGFVWDTDGHIVTNYHVVAGGTAFIVTLADPEKTKYEAVPVGVAPDKDLAVLKIDAPTDQLRPIEVGSSSDLVVGQRVLALGNPFGLDQSLTVGVVSALGRELQAPDGSRTIRDIIQTDAAINPGNSGGPLLDSSGRLIGVNSAIYSPSGASAGIGFAIPADTVKRLVPQIIRYGRPKQVGIGITVFSDNWSRSYDLDGIVVREVRRGGPAARAGIEPATVSRRGNVGLGDQIVAVDGEPVNTVDELLYAFERREPGDRVELTLLNDGRRRTVTVELDELRD